MRSYKNAPFWIMEQQSGPSGWEIMGRTPPPGQLSLWAVQSVAHGADAVVFFRWRSCAMGTEQFWHGILPHSGRPGRVYQELKDLTAQLTPIMEQMQGAMPRSRVAIVYSFRQKYALGIQPQHPELDYLQHVLKYYTAFYEKGISVDFVQDTQDLSGYALVVAPLQYLMTEELEDRYFRYVEQGGHLVLTMRTGVKDEHNLAMTAYPLPGRLAKLIGATVEEYDCLLGTSVKIACKGREYDAYKWSDILVPDRAETAAVYASEYYQGQPAVTKNTFGKGVAWYVGMEPGESLMDALVEDMLHDAGVSAPYHGDHGVEFAARTKGTQTWLFVLNHNGGESHYEIPNGYRLVKGGTAGVLNAYEVHIFESRER